jgi:hypothetical protein
VGVTPSRFLSTTHTRIVAYQSRASGRGYQLNTNRGVAARRRSLFALKTHLVKGWRALRRRQSHRLKYSNREVAARRRSLFALKTHFVKGWRTLRRRQSRRSAAAASSLLPPFARARFAARSATTFARLAFFLASPWLFLHHHRPMNDSELQKLGTLPRRRFQEPPRDEP